MKIQPNSAFSLPTARWLALALLLIAGAALAQQPAAVSAGDPPARVGTLTAAQGSVVFAAAGQTQWVEVPRNRPVTRGDRLWTDEGARAELHFGSAVIHMDARTFVEVVDIDEDVVQLRVNEGVVNARVREIRGGDNFEIDTPQLALRATEPGDWRMDVDPQRGFTRVAVRSGMAVVYGAGGGARQVAAGQQFAFSGRDLAQLPDAPQLADRVFERWAQDRNRAEDQSIAARHIPRDVVGYQELDNHGTWSHDPTYGPVWYPQVSVADWAPYRYGRWEWIAPWGWTWIDDAPWGFAPFHYGRWTTIGSRWAWVPGPLGRRPVYAPALVAFVGGSNVSFSFSSGPGIGWYPLAPGEAWHPFYDASPVYVRNVNRYVVTSTRHHDTHTHHFLGRPEAITAVRVEDFNRGRHVPGRWGRVHFNDTHRVQPFTPPIPSREFRREQREQHVRHAPRPPVERREFTPRPQPQWHGEPGPQWRGGGEQRDARAIRGQHEQRRDLRREQRDALREERRALHPQREHRQREQQVRETQAPRQPPQWHGEQQPAQALRREALRQQQHEAQRQEALREQHEAQRQEAVREQQARRQQAWQAQQQHQQAQEQRAWAQQQRQMREEQQQQHRQAQAQEQHRQAQAQEQRAWAQQQRQGRAEQREMREGKQEQAHPPGQQRREDRREGRRDERAQREDDSRGNGRGRRWE